MDESIEGGSMALCDVRPSPLEAKAPYQRHDDGEAGHLAERWFRHRYRSVIDHNRLKKGWVGARRGIAEGERDRRLVVVVAGSRANPQQIPFDHASEIDAQVYPRSGGSSHWLGQGRMESSERELKSLAGGDAYSLELTEEVSERKFVAEDIPLAIAAHAGKRRTGARAKDYGGRSCIEQDAINRDHRTWNAYVL